MVGSELRGAHVASNPGLSRRFFRSRDDFCHGCEKICVEGLGSRLEHMYNGRILRDPSQQMVMETDASRHLFAGDHEQGRQSTFCRFYYRPPLEADSAVAFGKAVLKH